VSGWPPRWLSPVPVEDVESGDGDLFCRFVEQHCRVTKSSVAAPAGDLIRFRPWQRDLTSALFARRPDGRLRHRMSLIGIARKNGKSAWLTGVGIACLVLGPDGGEVYSVAGDRDQARIIHSAAKRTVELDPMLRQLCKVYRDAIEVPSIGSVWKVTSAEAPTKEGLSPTAVLFDEVHVQPTRELWDVFALAMGARTEPIMIGITTAGVMTGRDGQDSLCYGLYQHGQRVASGEVDDDQFFFAWWEPKVGAAADHHDPEVWAESNPGLGDIVALDDFEGALKRTPESEFRTKRCNQWTASATSWLPHGVWEGLEVAEAPPAGERVALGFDGSYSGDSTAIVGCTLEDDPRVFVVAHWERPGHDPGQQWRVPILEVEQAVREACARWDVAEVGCDPYRYARSIQLLVDEGFPVEEWNTSTSARMVPACARFYEAVVDGKVRHDGDPGLARHLRNCQIKVDPSGPRIKKDHATSPRKIDLAVAAVIAFERAQAHRETGDPWVAWA
jgi:phage terminase large subunit-like protein